MRQTHRLCSANYSANYSNESSPVLKVSSKRKILNHEFLTNFSSTASVDPKNMWSIFEGESKQYGQNITNTQKDNIDKFLVFVSHDLLIVAPRLTIGLKDWPLFCNHLRFCR